jgi:hypothetical protein
MPDQVVAAIQVVLSFLGIVFIIISLKKWRDYKTKTDFIKKKKKQLQLHSIDELMRFLDDEKSLLLGKIEKGIPFLDQIKAQVKVLEGETAHISAGLVPPVFNIVDSEALKDSVIAHRNDQYKLIKNRKATQALTSWTWFDDEREGTRMVNDYQTLLLKAFNDDFEVIRKQMRVNKIDTAREKLLKLEDQLSRLGETANVKITQQYVQLKINELIAWHKELIHKDDKKAARKREQQEIREQNKQNSIDTEALDDAISVRDSELKKAQAKAEKLAGTELANIMKMIDKITTEKAKLEEKLTRATSQAQITRSGYVYVISNRGSFGKGVLKIGMTRRLEPMDRVNELGDASVPFKFGVHTLAYVDNAPSVEKALHAKFNDRRVNVENERKEFFRVEVDEVKKAMEAMSIESDWYFNVEAKEYDESMLIIAAEEKQRQETKEDNEIALPESI